MKVIGWLDGGGVKGPERVIYFVSYFCKKKKVKSCALEFQLHSLDGTEMAEVSHILAGGMQGA